MGYPMAGHLRRAGHDVTVYNRTATKADQWAAEYGGASAPTPRQAAKDADLVFCCVGNDDDLRSVVLGEHGAFAGMKKDAVFVDHTTASAMVARELLLRVFGIAQRRLLFFLVVAIALAISAFYELIEWWAALLLGADATDFLGTQGDVWDTQWDMFLALCGAILAQLALAGVHDRQLACLGAPVTRP